MNLCVCDVMCCCQDARYPEGMGVLQASVTSVMAQPVISSDGSTIGQSLSNTPQSWHDIHWMTSYCGVHDYTIPAMTSCEWRLCVCHRCHRALPLASFPTLRWGRGTCKSDTNHRFPIYLPTCTPLAWGLINVFGDYVLVVKFKDIYVTVACSASQY